MQNPRLLFLFCALLSGFVSRPHLAADDRRPDAQRVDGASERRNVVLVTFDGARVEEVFGGLDAAVFGSTLKEGDDPEAHPVYRRFWAETPEERRAKLMPFFWNTLMRDQGSIAGLDACGSEVRLTNRHWFSYPGYAEILLGVAHDDRISSNDPVQNPFRTALEFIASELHLAPAEAAVFGSWEVFNAIAESQAGALTVNAGYEPSAGASPLEQTLSALQAETPTPWNSVRHDAYTVRFAMAHLEAHKPRLLYLALGETDDWAHDGRYDRVLEAFARSDAYLRELWTWLQNQPEYRGRTSLLLTTDHGRGTGPADWRHHGSKYPGSARTWMAFVSPGMARRGVWCGESRLAAAQAAATLIDWMGLDWRRFNPAAAPPVR
jgi:hypothetical protein